MTNKRIAAGPIGLAMMGALLALPAVAQEKKESNVKQAGDIATQPIRDVGLDEKKIPPVLLDAADDPYSQRGASTCRALSGSIRELNAELGPDFGVDTNGKRKTSVAKVGGQAVVNSLIPFRGIVREVSGAAASDRRLAAATQAGIARRGFLRGLYTQRRCQTGM